MAGGVIHEHLDHAERFAAFLRMLKNRSGLGFHQLGKLAGVSSSSLHRYCSGTSVPQDYRIVLSFARACGATSEEIRNLHRLWAAAEAVRRTEPAGPPPSTATPAPGTTASAPHTTAPSPDPATSSPSAVDLAKSPVDLPKGTVDPRPGTGDDLPPRPQAPGDDAPGPDAAPEPMITVEAAPPADPPRTDPRRRHLALAVAGAVVVILAAAGLLALRGPGDATDPGPVDDRMLFSRACQDPVSMGQNDECVREVQNLLIQAGGRLAADGSFGPETLRRVTAFQVLSGLPPRGVVDDETKRALYEQRARLSTWAPDQVDSRIRQVFVEDPDRAVAIARCQSRLDPLHITPNTNGSRNWGLFQISDSSIASLGGTQATALDPEWNITAAHTLWRGNRDFHHWPFCEAALNSAPPSAPSASVPVR